MKRGVDKTAVSLGLAIAAFGLAGCASSVPHNAPAWYANAVQSQPHGYPDLRAVPHTNNANTNAAHWAAVQADLEGARQQMQANPRDVPAPAEDPNVFVDDARAVLDATRAAHHDDPQQPPPAPPPQH